MPRKKHQKRKGEKRRPGKKINLDTVAHNAKKTAGKLGDTSIILTSPVQSRKTHLPPMKEKRL